MYTYYVNIYDILIDLQCWQLTYIIDNVGQFDSRLIQSPYPDEVLYELLCILWSKLQDMDIQIVSICMSMSRSFDESMQSSS